MLTDTKLKSMKPQDRLYKVSDRDGLYVAVTTNGMISFRYDYRFNGRRETVTFGKYGADGITLAQARELLNEAKKQLNAGISPAASKRDGIDAKKGATVFSEYTVRYLREARLADSARAMKASVIERVVVN